MKAPVSLHDAAVEYAKRGWTIFPCKPRGKKPLTPEGFKNATADLPTIRRWWSKNPESNIGLAPGKSGLVVIDIDSIEMIEVARAEGLLDAPTLTVKTARGLHLYFQHPGRQVRNSTPWGKGIDVRGDSGYVIIPPSIHETGKQYRWQHKPTIRPLPAHVAAILWNPTRRNSSPKTPVGVGKTKTPEVVAEGGRNNELTSYLGRLRAEGFSEAQLSEAAFEFNGTYCVPPLDADEVHRVVVSVAKYPVGAVAADDAVDRLNQSHALVLAGGKVLVLRETREGFELLRPSEFRVLFANQFCSTQKGLRCVAEVWISHPRRREYSTLVFEPGSTTTDKAYNIWKGWGVTPSDSGSFSLLDEHLLENLCHGAADLHRYVMAWFANIFQHPRQKPGTALVIRGERGTGKSIVGKLIGKLLGQSYISVANSRHVVGHFNAHLITALLIQLDEAFWAGDHTAEGVLKDMITSDFRLVERKGVDAIQFPNYSRLYITSNSHWIVPAGPLERRYVVLDAGKGRIQDTKYFSAMIDQMESGGYEALLKHFLTEDYSDVDLRKVPHTPGLIDQQIANLGSEESWFYDILQDGRLPGDDDGVGVTASATLYDHYVEHSKKVGYNRRAIETRLGRFLFDLIPNLEDGREKRGVAGNVRVLRFPSLAECREAFEKSFRQPLTWSASVESWGAGVIEKGNF